MARLPRSARDDAGSAVVEFTFLAVLVMVPLVYLVVAVAAVQRASTAVGEAARAGGRALATADTVEQGLDRARTAIRIAVQDANLPADQARLQIVAPDSSCDGPQVIPTLAPGDEYAVCVVLRVALPAVPSYLPGGGVQTTGRFVVHVDDYRG